MKLPIFCTAIAAAAALLGPVSMQAAPPPPPLLIPPRGSHFEATGRVSLHVSQPCTPQIMFDFRGRKIIWLGAPKRETALLTEAARHNRRVRVSGLWRHGAHSGCAFVEVTRVVLVEPKFLGIF
jgi:hypothetical protein